MSRRDYSPGRVEWVQQADAVLNQAAPVQNTWYTVLAATGRYTLIENIYLAVQTANETLEGRVVVDGLTKTVEVFAATAGSNYQVRDVSVPTSADTLYAMAAGVYNLNRAGHNVSVSIRKTTATGAGNLQCKVIYAVM